jgi:hypothetical protein
MMPFSAAQDTIARILRMLTDRSEKILCSYLNTAAELGVFLTLPYFFTEILLFSVFWIIIFRLRNNQKEDKLCAEDTHQS